jgi:hypothetical protein
MAVKVDWCEGFEGPPGPEGWRILWQIRDARVVSRSRTTLTESGVADLPSGPVPVHRKVYVYRGVAAILGGAFRTTFAAPGRARRELAALRRLGALGLAPLPVAVGERRTAGFLRQAILATRTVDGGRDLGSVPPDAALAAAAGRAAGTIHAAGLGDLSLAPRNLVAARDGDGPWRIAKVDSGDLREVARGGPEQARDLADLVAGLEKGWPEEMLAALRVSYVAAAGALPPGLDAALADARARLARRDPR